MNSKEKKIIKQEGKTYVKKNDQNKKWKNKGWSMKRIKRKIRGVKENKCKPGTEGRRRNTR